MDTKPSKIRLSPQLRLGVGRNYFKNNIFKYSGFLFLLLSAVLGGWTVYTIAQQRGVTSLQSTATPQVLGATDTKSQDAFIDYTIVKGDTIFNIAQKYKVEWSALATLNNLASPYTLHPGQQLKVPYPNLSWAGLLVRIRNFQLLARV